MVQHRLQLVALRCVAASAASVHADLALQGFHAGQYGRGGGGAVGYLVVDWATRATAALNNLKDDNSAVCGVE